VGGAGLAEQSSVARYVVLGLLVVVLLVIMVVVLSMVSVVVGGRWLSCC